MGSRSSRALSQALNILQVHPDPARSKYKTEREFYSRRARRMYRRSPTTIINWGNSVTPPHLEGNSIWINKPECVSLSSDKLRTLQELTEAGVPCPEFTTDYSVMREWLSDGNVLMARHLLRAHSGRGLTILDPQAMSSDDIDSIPSCPLWTKYIKKTHEYRVHVLPDRSLHIVQKRRNMSVPDDQIDWRIRNHGNGFIFAAELAHKPDDIEELAYRVAEVLGLDFCALDIVYNSHLDKSFLIESNTACGIEGRTLDLYTNSFKRKLNL